MPGAADAVADHEPFGQRPVIMAAMRVDREDLGARAHQQHFLVADMAEQRLALEVARGDALRQIGPAGAACCSAMFTPASLQQPVRRQFAMPRNSWRVSALSRKQPSMRLVTRSVPGLCTPRVVMQ